MAIVPIDIPSGMMRNGTPYSARGRWTDGNLIRWHNGSLRPIGGWVERTTTPSVKVFIDLDPDEVVRNCLDFRTNLGNTEAVFFSNTNVYHLNSGNGITDITPVGYHQGLSEVIGKSGYGTGAYGVQTYGTNRTGDNIQIVPVDRAYVDMWGEDVLFGVVNHGPIYQYDASAGGVGTVLANAPVDVADMIVTDQRIVMAIKNTPEIRTVQWSDRENNTEWTPAIDNYADSRMLQGHGRLLGLYKVLNQILVLSETDAHVGRFLGAPFVYGFERVGTGCEPVHKNAVGITDRFAIWLGKRNFWVYDGTIKKQECDVMDFLAKDFNPNMASKIHTHTVAAFSEIWWFYQSVSGTEVDSYVVLDYDEGHWSTGRLARTTAFDRGVYENPIYVAVDGTLYDHEVGGVRPEGEIFARTGPLELNNGGRNMAVRYVFPDTEAKNEIELRLYTRSMPTEDDYEHGPFEYSNPISTTGVLGREVRMEPRFITGRGEIGTMRFDVQEVGGGFR